MADLAIAIKIATEDQSSGPISKIKGALGGLGEAITAPTRAIGGLVSGLGQIGLAVQGVGAVVEGVKGVGSLFGIGALNEMEQTRASFMAFTKDAAKTEELLEGVRKEAALTPFAFGEMAKATASLLPVSKSSGVAIEDLRKQAEILAASNPLEGLEGASFSLREAMTGDFTSIIERFNLSRTTINKLKEEGVPNLEIVRRAMAEMGFDSDLIAAKAETLDGRWSTFQDTLVSLQTRMGQPIFDAMKESLVGLQGVLDDNMGMFEGWADQVALGIKGVIDVTKGLLEIFLGGGDFDRVGEMLDTFFPFDVSNAIMAAVSDLGGVFEAVFQGDVPGAVRYALGFLDDIGAIISGLVEDWASAIAGWVDGADSELLGNLGDMALDIYDWILDAGIAIVEKLGAWAAAFVDWIGPKLPDLIREYGKFLGGMLGWIGGTALPTLVEKLAEWGVAFVAWVAPRIPPLLVEAGKLLLELGGWLLGTALPAIVGKLAEWGAAFVDWVAPKIPPLLLELGALGLQVGQWLATTALPAIVEKLAEWGLAFVEWVAPRIPPLLEALGGLLVEVGTWLITTALPDMVSKLAEWAVAFVAWVGPKIPELLLELGKLEVEVISWIGQKVADLVSKLVEWGGAFLGWVAKDVLPTLPEKLGAILTAISGWVGDSVGAVAESVKAIGGGILQGIQDGVSGALSGFWGWLQTNFVDQIPSFVKKLLNINSPSGVFMDIGANMVAGLRVGMERELPSVDDLITNVIGKLGGAVGDSGGKVRSYITRAALDRDIDPRAALAVAKHEGGEDDYMRVGKFATGWSFWPFQLHYGGKGYEYFGTEAGMGNDFTRQTGLQPGDWRAWDESINFALDRAKKYGWGAWYGRIPAGIDEWEGIRNFGDGGWITEPVVGIGVHSGRGYAFGERGEDELVTPRSRLGRMAAGGDVYNFYGVQPESVLAEADRRKRQRALLASARSA